MTRLLRTFVIAFGALGIAVLGLFAFINRNAPSQAEIDRVLAQSTQTTNEAEPTALPRGYVSRALLGDRWPLTVDEGTLSCQRSALLFYSGGDVYAVNGTARGQIQRQGWKDIHDLSVATGDGTIKSLQPLLDLGLDLCR